MRPGELAHGGEREMKIRQSAKIKELAEAVHAAGFRTVNQQAKALGLSRSTVWTIRKASHKASGLSASIINRMLASPQLPPLARSKIMEYVEEKAAGLYGGPAAGRRRLRSFIDQASEVGGIRGNGTLNGLIGLRREIIQATKQFIQDAR